MGFVDGRAEVEARRLYGPDVSLRSAVIREASCQTWQLSAGRMWMLRRHCIVFLGRATTAKVKMVGRGFIVEALKVLWLRGRVVFLAGRCCNW
jgi:hypothetical protein